jgi:hypothetical protein
MPDIVQSNEFVFTPSAFICAYIEQKTPSETIVETNAFGAIDRDISPKSIENLLKRSSLLLSPSSGFSGEEGGTGNSLFGANRTVVGKEPAIARVDGTFINEFGVSVTIKNAAEELTSARPNYDPGLFTIESGLKDLGNTIQIAGNATDVVGQEYNEAAKTDTKTTVKTIEELATVVLVLTYGEYRAKCSNPQSTVNSIYTQVLAYFNSL